LHKQRKPNKSLTPQEIADRVFIGVFPAAISYADRKVEEHGDYKTLAILPYSTLELEVRPGCPPALLQYIAESAAEIQAKRGQEFRISACGQAVLLGSALPR
jgi:hypothetical protein